MSKKDPNQNLQSQIFPTTPGGRMADWGRISCDWDFVEDRLAGVREKHPDADLVCIRFEVYKND